MDFPGDVKASHNGSDEGGVPTPAEDDREEDDFGEDR